MELALQEFPKERFEIEWKSFELDPHASPSPGVSNDELLAKKYGKTLEWAQQMNAQITQMALEVGLTFQMDKVIPANSFNAHRLLQLAKKHGLQSELKESLMKAKFCDGHDIANIAQLTQLASTVGIPHDEVVQLFESNDWESDVRKDEELASYLGIRGVPFFVFNRKAALSGAQPPESFVETISSLKDIP